MLSIKTYPAAYIDRCQTRFNAQLAELANCKTTPAFTAGFVTDLVLVLEQSFVHRMRGNEGKDGNPLNEVRMLARWIGCW